MAYRYGNRTQLTFLPDSIEKYVGNEDPVRVYDAFINALDRKELGLQINANCVGNSTYDPVSMLKILVYAYSYGWRSSRKIERALHHNLSFIWIAGGLKPDHKTISKFRRDNKEVLKNVLKQNARICLKLGLIEGNTLFVDGSKFRANAGKSQSKSKKTWEFHKEEIEKRIEFLFEECQRTDESETESLVVINKDLQSAKKLKSKIDKILEKIKNEDQINGTDPDCTIMKGRNGSHAGYNGQMVTDESHGLIISADVVSSKNDLNQMQRQIENAEETIEKESENVCADAGYSSVDDIKLLVDKGKTVIVPNNKQSQHKPKDDPFGKHNFEYNAETNSYTCPAGKQMICGAKRKDSNRIEYRMKNSSDCKACKYFGECTTCKAGRRLYRLVNEETKKNLEILYESEKGQAIYVKRKMLVELPFGHIKRNLNAGAFLLRGFDGAKAEFSLLCSSFNIARLITILGGVIPAKEALSLAS